MQIKISKETALEDSPTTLDKWKEASNLDRISLIKDFLMKKDEYKNFEVIKTEQNGNVILRTEVSISASERGILLLNLEENLKSSIDHGITVWLEPVGDKSKLRNLRGIKINSEI
tara:strand:+ start:202 stop:546 length:345 start_codon:yes stop_codon:yes gene_type:complete